MSALSLETPCGKCQAMSTAGVKTFSIEQRLLTLEQLSLETPNESDDLVALRCTDEPTVLQVPTPIDGPFHLEQPENRNPATHRRPTQRSDFGNHPRRRQVLQQRFKRGLPFSCVGDDVLIALRAFASDDDDDNSELWGREQVSS